MTKPVITDFHTRADLRLRVPLSISRNLFPSRGGVTLHYGGPAQNITSHDQCKARWKAWQDYHMNTHGWVDIAYTGGFCDHGYAFAGRGIGIRTAANGTNAGNDGWYAVTWIGGHGETPTPAALAAAAWWIAELRAEGGAASRVNNHDDHKSTACAGDPLRHFIRTGIVLPEGPQIDLSEHVPAPPPAPRIVAPPYPLAGDAYFGYRSGDRNSVSGFYHRLPSGKPGHPGLQKWQQQMIKRGWVTVPGTREKFVADGLFGDATAAVALAFSSEKGLQRSRRVGRTIWSAAWTAALT